MLKSQTIFGNLLRNIGDMNSILFIQHGDFADAFNRFAAGGMETYRDQRASVDFVAEVSKDSRVTVFSFGNDISEVQIGPNLFARSGNKRSFGRKEIFALFEELGATHLVLRTPHVGFLTEATRRRIPVLPSFADIFSSSGFRGRYRNLRLRRALIQSKAPCFANHSLNASLSLNEILNLPRDMIVPWDWTRIPVVNQTKSQVLDTSMPTAFFAGKISADKGVGDCLEAIALLRRSNVELKMSFAGPGEVSGWMNRAAQLGITKQVKFMGVIANSEVRNQMYKNDFVVVPSRHSYSEGLPNTIYEGLASRSALIISDHPAFAGRLKPDKECLVFKAADPESLAASIQRGTKDNLLYEQLSRNSVDAHDQLYLGVEWTSLVSSFIKDPTNRTSWVEQSSLKSLGY